MVAKCRTLLASSVLQSECSDVSTLHSMLATVPIDSRDCCADLAHECTEAQHIAAATWFHTPGACLLFCRASGLCCCRASAASAYGFAVSLVLWYVSMHQQHSLVKLQAVFGQPELDDVNDQALASY